MATLSLITIGDELLKGRTVNTNASHTGEMLRNNGYSLSRVVTISDQRKAIRSTLEEELLRSDVILISGGLGPTKDDITKFTLAEIFQSELVVHPPTLSFLEERYKRRNRQLTELTRRQAWVPAGCEVIHNSKGTAPGMLFRSGEKLIFSMPGVPFEMLHMLEYEIIPIIKATFPQDVFLHEIIRLANIPESVAAKRMESVEESLPPEVNVAYLPRHDGLWLELSIQMPQDKENEANKLLKSASELVADHLKDKVYARGGQPLAKEVADLFGKQPGLTLAVAESLTGGRIAAKIVEIPGASSFFKGSVTAYASSVKLEVLKVPQQVIDDHTVVSREVAEAMAEGVRKLLNADIGLSTTGLAEKDRNQQPNAWLGYSDKHGNEAIHVEFLHGREVNIERAANYTLQLCLKKVRDSFE